MRFYIIRKPNGQGLIVYALIMAFIAIITFAVFYYLASRLISNREKALGCLETDSSICDTNTNMLPDISDAPTTPDTDINSEKTEKEKANMLPAYIELTSRGRGYTFSLPHPSGLVEAH